MDIADPQIAPNIFMTAGFSLESSNAPNKWSDLRVPAGAKILRPAGAAAIQFLHCSTAW